MGRMRPRGSGSLECLNNADASFIGFFSPGFLRSVSKISHHGGRQTWNSTNAAKISRQAIHDSRITFYSAVDCEIGTIT